MRFLLHFLAALLLLSGWGEMALAQKTDTDEKTVATEDEASEATKPIGVPIKLDISRRFLKNFLTDEIALIPYQTTADQPLDLHGAFTIGSPSARYAVIWDPDSCRIAGVLDLKSPPAPKPVEKSDAESDDAEDAASNTESKAPSPYTLLAEGPPPLNRSSGASGLPKYFGFRLNNGKPEFLYTHGILSVEECIWLEDAGNVLKQRFAIRDPKSDVVVSLPDSWKSRVESSVGTWKGNALSVPAEDAGDILLTFQLGTPETEPKEEN